MPKKSDAIKKYDEGLKPSRSAKKREALALQRLGEELAALSSEERANLNLPDDLMEALRQYDLISDREGKRRQRQFIGRVMRETDTAHIASAMEKRRNIRLGHAALFHKIEKWRDRLLAAERAELDSLLNELLLCAGVRDYGKKALLSELVARAVMEKEGAQNRGASRQLFREIIALFPSQRQ